MKANKRAIATATVTAMLGAAMCHTHAMAARPKYWVDTFQNAPGYSSPTDWRDRVPKTGTLYAGTSYVYCKIEGPVVSDSQGQHNKYWLYTDLDTGAVEQWVSAYFRSRWGNDVAKDNSGRVIPNC